MVLCFFVLGLLNAASRKGKRKPADERVRLVHADELMYDAYGPNPDVQIVKGHVAFTHKGARLNCDSAYFYQGNNSMRAFGHVRFRQGDTLSLTCDRAWYNGEEQMLEARQNVVLRHRKQTLYTDSLNYDRLYEYAYFFNGGRLIDGKTKLSSDWGEYHTATRMARFNLDVQLKTPKNRISTDTLYYDTRKSRAHVVGMYTTDKGRGKKMPSVIRGKNNTITTTDGYFNTAKDEAELYGRSTVVSKGKTITADTLFYNSATGKNRGKGRVIFVDDKNRQKVTCEKMEYNEKIGRGYATKNLLVMDYSRKDTLYMHADTMRIETFNINTDSAFRKVHCYNKVRTYRVDIQSVCDSLVFNSKDSCLTMYRNPVIWNAGRQLLGEVVKVFMNDSTVREAHVLGQALSVEQLPDSTYYNQVSSKDMYAYFVNGQMRRSDAVRNVRSIYFPIDNKDSTLIGLNYVETDTMKMYMSPNRQLERIWMPKAQGTLYPMTQAPPTRYKLDVFAWFDYMRPKNKDDVFVWRAKTQGSELKNIVRHAAPIQQIKTGRTSTPKRREKRGED
ncbi:OstA-like protein [Prevotella sp. S7-1-8]|uniref:OstA-like protein n=1 Tax=Prevotella sp. S7-1-8 TaxID=1284775 RepID=UPI000B31EF03|nr:OstA-like protein [Prevotella sp. S7-1-8]